jgi:hypothetical protein
MSGVEGAPGLRCFGARVIVFTDNCGDLGKQVWQGHLVSLCRLRQPTVAVDVAEVQLATWPQHTVRLRTDRPGHGAWARARGGATTYSRPEGRRSRARRVREGAHPRRTDRRTMEHTHKGRTDGRWKGQAHGRTRQLGRGAASRGTSTYRLTYSTNVRQAVRPRQAAANGDKGK